MRERESVRERDKVCVRESERMEEILLETERLCVREGESD